MDVTQKAFFNPGNDLHERGLTRSVKPYNADFKTYPNHRNRTHKNKRSLLETYTKGLCRGLIQRGFLSLQGNKNIHWYIPCYNCDKYPPIYGSRVLIDNSNYNIENPIDFIGIHVDEFTALELDALDSQGNYAWVEKLKQDLLYLKRYGWTKLYKKKYDKEPDATPVIVRHPEEPSDVRILH